MNSTQSAYAVLPPVEAPQYTFSQRMAWRLVGFLDTLARVLVWMTSRFLPVTGASVVYNPDDLSFCDAWWEDRSYIVHVGRMEAVIDLRKT